MKTLRYALSARTITVLVALVGLAAGLAFVSIAAAIAVPSALLFLMAVPAETLITRRGGS